MNFTVWFYENIILKDRNLQRISMMDRKEKWIAVSSEMGKMKRSDPERYFSLKRKFEESKASKERAVEDVPSVVSEPPEILVPKTHRIDEYYMEDYFKNTGRQTNTEEYSPQLSLFKNLKISTLLKALKKVSDVR